MITPPTKKLIEKFRKSDFFSICKKKVELLCIFIFFGCSNQFSKILEFKVKEQWTTDIELSFFAFIAAQKCACIYQIVESFRLLCRCSSSSVPTSSWLQQKKVSFACSPGPAPPSKNWNTRPQSRSFLPARSCNGSELLLLVVVLLLLLLVVVVVLLLLLLLIW